MTCPTSASSWPQSILVVDDEPGIRDLVAWVLTKVAHKSFSLEPLSISDWLVSGTFTGFLLAYVTGLGLLARWLLRWLFGT